MTLAAALDAGLEALGLPLENGARAQLLAYVALLAKWNRTYNLTAIREPSEMVGHHLLDSLAIVPHLPMPQREGSLADVGSGAGLPGIPLAIARPQWRVALNDSKQKKAAFMRQAAIELGLKNVEVSESRAEGWQPAKRFAVVVSRAFSDLAAFISACRHLVAPGGALVAMKGTVPHAELRQLPSGWIASIVRLSVPQLDAERHLILLRLGG